MPVGDTRIASVLSRSATARLGGVAIALLVLWLAVAWAVAVP